MDEELKAVYRNDVHTVAQYILDMASDWDKPFEDVKADVFSEIARLE